MSEVILRGARQHNLKNVDVRFPRNSLVVIAGPSGSGKSSLAFDTLCAEAQRRYLECLPAYARGFIDRLPRPNLDGSEGLSPPIAVDNTDISRTPRSTVGTLTGIYDHLRIVFARIGQPFCSACGHPVVVSTLEEIVDRIMAEDEGQRVMVLAPLDISLGIDVAQLRKDGFIRVRINGEVRNLEDDFNPKSASELEVVVDRFAVRLAERQRAAEAIELAIRLGRGWVRVNVDGRGEWTAGNRLQCPFCATELPELRPDLFSFNSAYGQCAVCRGTGTNDAGEVCPTCEGSRLRKEALDVKLQHKNIFDVSSLTIHDAMRWFESVRAAHAHAMISDLIRQALVRMRFLIDLELTELTLHQRATELSSGELGRVRVASQLSADLSGILYVLDEPLRGLHPGETHVVIRALKQLRDHGNTVVVVEHDRAMLDAGDFIIEMGPGSGKNGGYILSVGSPSDVCANQNSNVGAYMLGAKTIDVPRVRRSPSRGFISIPPLQGFSSDIRVPLGVLTCITGPSGTGKTRLLKSLEKAAKENQFEEIERVVFVDDSPIGRTPSSSPATYTGIMNELRQIYASLPEARVRGYSANRFSLTSKGGRCEACEGTGAVHMDVPWLADLYAPCSVCEGKRFNRETLEIRYRGNHIADSLKLTVAEALSFFEAFPKIHKQLHMLQRVGLAYLELGQSATTLSSGETQRLKLSRELARKPDSQTLVLLDEPTVGLGFSDVETIVHVLQQLVEHGSTLVLAEHDLDVIKNADHLLDLMVNRFSRVSSVAMEGTPEELAHAKRSPTAEFLSHILPLQLSAN